MGEFSKGAFCAFCGNTTCIFDKIELRQQASFDAENRVQMGVFIVRIKNTSDQCLIPVRFKNVMQMRRPVGVSAKLAEHLTHWSVIGDRIKAGLGPPQK